MAVSAEEKNGAGELVKACSFIVVMSRELLAMSNLVLKQYS